MRKWWISLLFICCILALKAPTVSAAEIVDSGYCGGEGDGTNLTWTLDSEGTLTISGTGKMEDYIFSNSSPWYVSRNAIKTLTLSNSVTSIESYAFSGCSGLTSVTIPNSVTYIGYSAFEGCRGLTSIEIPNSVTSIWGAAFSGCSGLTSVTIPNSITSIGDSAFERCNGLTSIEIPNSVTYIGDWTFEGCSGLTSVTIPNSVTSIGDRTFGACSRLTSVTIPNSVTSIESYAFSGCSGLTSITIPNSVTSIGDSAFWRSGLTSVTIPNSITSIGDSAFRDCISLTSVTISNSVTSIGDSVFRASIGDSAFRDCISLTSIEIPPNSVISIGNSAFCGCSGLINVRIPNSVTYIGYSAFRDCSGLTSITIPNGVTSIGVGSFLGCSGLTSITIPNSVTYIGDAVFRYCIGLTSVTIPSSITSIRDSAFDGCSGLTDIYFSGTQEQWDTIEKTKSGLSSDVIIHYESNGPDESSAPAKSLAFSKYTYIAGIGETIAVSAEYTGPNSPSDYHWSCTDTEAVSIYAETSVLGPSPEQENTYYISRQVTGVLPGTYEITLEADGLTATTTLKITKPHEIHLSKNTYSIQADELGIINADWTYYPANASTIRWSISGDAIEESPDAIAEPVFADGRPAPQDSFRFKGVHTGQATITATLPTGESDSCVVTVEDVNPYYLVIIPYYGVSIQEGENATVQAAVCARDTQRFVDDRELDAVTSIVWESSNGDFAAFDKNGKVKEESDHISHGLWGNKADTIKVYGRSIGKSAVSCTVQINGYTISKSVQVSVSSKETSEMVKRINNWTDAYAKYISALEEYLEKDSKKDNAIPVAVMGKLLMEADFNHPDTRLVQFTNNTLNRRSTAGAELLAVRTYVYEGVAQFLADRGSNAFPKIKVKDVSGLASDIAKAACDYVDTNPYLCTFYHNGEAVSVQIKGISAGGAHMREIIYNGEKVADMISSTDEIMAVLIDYGTRLCDLSQEVIKQAYKEALKELFSKDISGLMEESVQHRVEDSLGDYISRFSETGINNVVKDVQYCFDYYAYLKTLFSASASDPQSILTAMGKLDFNSKPDNVKVYSVKRAMKSIKNASSALEDLLKKAVVQDGGDYGQFLTDVYDIIFHFHCPITIAVYSGDVQVGLLSEDEIWYDSDFVYIEQYGEEKNVYTHTETALRFEVVGTDEGTLNYIVEEFQDGESVQRMNYYDIDLYEGKTVSVSISGSTITDEDAIYSESDGQSILCDETLTADDYETASVMISSLANPNRGGQIQGCGSYVRGDRVVLRAVPENDFLFSGWWDENGELVSLDRVFEFTARDNVSLTAMFAEYEQETYDSDTVLITDVTVDDDDACKVRATIQCPEDIQATAYCAFFDGNGKMVDLELRSLSAGTNRISFTAGSATAAGAKFMVLDSELRPLCASEQVTFA